MTPWDALQSVRQAKACVTVIGVTIGLAVALILAYAVRKGGR